MVRRARAARAAELNYLKTVTDFGERSTAPALLENLRRRVEADGIGGKYWLEVQRLLSRAWMKLDLPEQALAAAEKLMAEAQLKVQNGRMSKAGLVLHQIAHASALEFAGKYDQALALLEEARRHSKEQAHTGRIEDTAILFCSGREISNAEPNSSAPNWQSRRPSSEPSHVS